MTVEARGGRDNYDDATWIIIINGYRSDRLVINNYRLTNLCDCYVSIGDASCCVHVRFAKLNATSITMHSISFHSPVTINFRIHVTYKNFYGDYCFSRIFIHTDNN